MTKTVAWVDEAHADDGVVLIHFTDGTALSVSGSSHEEVSMHCAHLDRAEVIARFRRDQGAREQRRLARLLEEEWLALSCEARAIRGDLTNDRSGAFILPSFLEGLLMVHLGARQITHRCERCGDRRCPNAKREVLTPSRGPFLAAGQITISDQMLRRNQ